MDVVRFFRGSKIEAVGDADRQRLRLVDANDLLSPQPSLPVQHLDTPYRPDPRPVQCGLLGPEAAHNPRWAAESAFQTKLLGPRWGSEPASRRDASPAHRRGATRASTCARRRGAEIGHAEHHSENPRRRFTRESIPSRNSLETSQTYPDDGPARPSAPYAVTRTSAPPVASGNGVSLSVAHRSQTVRQVPSSSRTSTE